MGNMIATIALLGIKPRRVLHAGRLWRRVHKSTLETALGYVKAARLDVPEQGDNA
jgi:hypothetical protein